MKATSCRDFLKHVANVWRGRMASNTCIVREAGWDARWEGGQHLQQQGVLAYALQRLGP